MTERRFTDAEVAAIFERAANAPQTSQPAVSSSEGMTLAQLQEIGREVGITPEAIRDAAQNVGRSGQVTTRKVLGVPLGVGRIIELDRKLTEDEWERLVVDLRETFDARGRVRSEGSLRQWTNGNLHAFLEPTATGQRLRIRTVKGQALRLMGGGLIAIAAAPFFATWVPAAVGVGLIAIGAALVPGWARLRQQQMEGVAARLASMTTAPPSP